MSEIQESETQNPIPFENNQEKKPLVSFPLTLLAIKEFKWIYILIISIIFAGIWSYSSLPKEWTPDIQIPILIVATPFPQSTPEDVESLVTYPLEKELKNINNLKDITSTSSEGVSIIRLEYDIGVDISEARADAKDAIDKVKPELPDDAEDTNISEVNLSEQPIMVVVLSGNMEMRDMTDLADDIADDIETIPGILEAKRTGGSSKEIQILIDPDKLSFYQIPLSTVNTAVGQGNINLPLGDFDNGSIKMMVRVVGEISKPEDLRDIIVTEKDNVPIYIKDIATVAFAEKELGTKARLFGTDSVSISVSKRAGENIQEIAQQIRKVIEKYKNIHKTNLEFKLLQDITVLIDNNLSNLENNIYTGLIFVVIVLMFFMGIRNAFFVGLAVPLSIFTSFVVLKIMGIGINFVVLFGLILGLGMLVDNAIVIVENIYRHIQLGKNKVNATIQGVSEVAYPVITSTLTTVAAFFPLIFMPGIIGEFVSYMPKTVIILLFSSLFVALVLNPVICFTLMKKPKTILSSNEDELEYIFKYKIYRIYMNLLGKCMDYWYLTLGTVIFSLVGIMAFYFLVIDAGVEFFPSDEPSESVIKVSAPFGTNLEESDRIVRKIENLVDPYHKYVDSVVSNVGSSRGSSSAGGGKNNSFITVSFPTWQDRIKQPSIVVQDIRDKLKKDEYQIAGAEISVEVSKSGPPGSKAVEIEISGPDLTVLKDISNKIKGEIYNEKGLVNLKDDLDLSRTEIVLIPDREKITQAGLTVSDISREIRSAFAGINVSTYRIGKDEYDINVRYLKKYRDNLNRIESFTVYNKSGQPFSLTDLVKVKNSLSFGAIKHNDNNRTVTLSGDAEGVPSTTLVSNLKKIVNKIDVQPGYRVNFGGEDEDQKEVQTFIQNAFMLAVLMIFLIILWDFRSIIKSLVILLTVPLSMIGVFLGLTLHQLPMSIVMSGIGFVSLSGVVVNNGVLLLDYIKYMRQKGHSFRDSILYTGVLRMRPIFLTATTTILGLIPMMFGMDINFYRFPDVVVFGAGTGAIWKPLSNAIAYGLLVSSLLTLFFIPTMYYTFARFKAFLFKKDIEEIHAGL